MKSRIRYGMVGGGEGAFIGAVHRHAAQLDGDYELVCGAFSATPEKSIRSGRALGVPPGRCYPDFHAMFEQEATLPPDVRMQCVVIVTPNHLHYAPAVEALQHGFHVLSDKPATFSLEECRRLAAMVASTGRLYGLTHPYTAYPAVVEARERVARGELGSIRKILVEYTQGWLAEAQEHQGNAQAAWRTDPARAGSSCCMGDIGVHAFNLVEHVSGLKVTRLCAELNTIVPGRRLDDDGTVLLHFDNGARGTLLASQICTGNENNLVLRLFGDKGALEWQQMDPNSLWLRYNDRSSQLLRTGTPAMGAAAQAATRVPAGHPEGYIEAFANLFRSFAVQVRAHKAGTQGATAAPGMDAALRGMAFIEAAVQSSRNGQRWLDLDAGSP
jgi:predicted dehydrogenase